MSFAKGTLIPVGGNENKGDIDSEYDAMEFISDGILFQVVKEAGGVDALIVIIPTASGYPVEVGQAYLDAFSKLGCTNLKVLDIRSQEDAESEENLDYIKKAQGVMFSGGDQSKIADKIGGTQFHSILAERYKNEEGFVIVGTSAGAMMMSQEMIAGGSSQESFIKGAVLMRNGLGLLPEVIFDTHFIMRGRFGRVSEAVAQFPNLLGVGLAEDTGMIIRNGNEMKVIGSGMAIIFDGSEISHNNHKVLEEGTPLTLANLKVHILSNSDRFDIEKREVRALPIGEPLDSSIQKIIGEL